MTAVTKPEPAAGLGLGAAAQTVPVLLLWLSCGGAGPSAPCCTSAETVVVPLRFCARLATTWLGSRCSEIVGVPRSRVMDEADAPAAVTVIVEVVVVAVVMVVVAVVTVAVRLDAVVTEPVDAVVLLLMLLLLLAGELAVAAAPLSPFTLWGPVRRVRTEGCCCCRRRVSYPLLPGPPSPPLTGGVPVSASPSDPVRLLLLLLALVPCEPGVLTPPLSALELSGFAVLSES